MHPNDESGDSTHDESSSSSCREISRFIPAKKLGKNDLSFTSKSDPRDSRSSRRTASSGSWRAWDGSRHSVASSLASSATEFRRDLRSSSSANGPLPQATPQIEGTYSAESVCSYICVGRDDEGSSCSENTTTINDSVLPYIVDVRTHVEQDGSVFSLQPKIRMCGSGMILGGSYYNEDDGFDENMTTPHVKNVDQLECVSPTNADHCSEEDDDELIGLIEPPVRVSPSPAQEPGLATRDESTMNRSEERAVEWLTAAYVNKLFRQEECRSEGRRLQRRRLCVQCLGGVENDSSSSDEDASSHMMMSRWLFPPHDGGCLEAVIQQYGDPIVKWLTHSQIDELDSECLSILSYFPTEGAFCVYMHKRVLLEWRMAARNLRRLTTMDTLRRCTSTEDFINTIDKADNESPSPLSQQHLLFLNVCLHILTVNLHPRMGQPNATKFQWGGATGSSNTPLTKRNALLKASDTLYRLFISCMKCLHMLVVRHNVLAKYCSPHVVSLLNVYVDTVRKIQTTRYIRRQIIREVKLLQTPDIQTDKDIWGEQQGRSQPSVHLLELVLKEYCDRNSVYNLLKIENAQIAQQRTRQCTHMFTKLIRLVETCYVFGGSSTSQSVKENLSIVLIDLLELWVKYPVNDKEDWVCFHTYMSSLIEMMLSSSAHDNCPVVLALSNTTVISMFGRLLLQSAIPLISQTGDTTTDASVRRLSVCEAIQLVKTALQLLTIILTTRTNNHHHHARHHHQRVRLQTTKSGATKQRLDENQVETGDTETLASLVRPLVQALALLVGSPNHTPVLANMAMNLLTMILRMVRIDTNHHDDIGKTCTLCLSDDDEELISHKVCRTPTKRKQKTVLLESHRRLLNSIHSVATRHFDQCDVLNGQAEEEEVVSNSSCTQMCHCTPAEAFKQEWSMWNKLYKQHKLSGLPEFAQPSKLSVFVSLLRKNVPLPHMYLIGGSLTAFIGLNVIYTAISGKYLINHWLSIRLLCIAVLCATSVIGASQVLASISKSIN